MKHLPFFYIAVVALVSIGICLSGCVNQEGQVTETGLSMISGTQVPTINPGPVQEEIRNEIPYEQERLSPELQSVILGSAPDILYFAMDIEMKELCIRSDPKTLVTILLGDPNAQDMLMKNGSITGIGPYLPRSGKTDPADGACTVAVYVSSRNVTSAFVIDQEKQVVSRQVIEVPTGTHVRTSVNRTIISINDSIVFVFSSQGNYSGNP